jgi:subtilisin family serine protease
MTRIVLAACFVLSGLTLSGQISDRLKEAMAEESDAFIPVKVLFESQIDILDKRRTWQQSGVPVDEWPRLVNRVLMKDAQSSQAKARYLIESAEPGQVESAVSFYIVNMMVVQAKPKLIYELYSLPEVSFIDLADEHWELIKPVSVGEPEQTTAAGVEPGLLAINAPPMWKLGYTGKGGIAYDYDTGVWPDHPTYANRFMGNFAPLSQSWYGYYNQKPSGVTGNHGTHVLGTIAGLNEQTGDTIGVAFGAYWIANDLIGNASIASDLPPLAAMVKGFEWALNPDGDTATSDDVPDVINNSWRWRDILDTVHCGGYIVQLMNAIEAAGMANVFSGGNTGPNNVGVNSPQRINTSVVNTFTVGSVNGNLSFPYPISNFSTRGPSQCGGTGSIHIHPEVVAPGQNVRSAWGTDSFNTISGTSMASPHVSGAILLLKEAFPQLSGDTLMAALYNSAIDLGAPGEDNTYGNGIIDVYAAYQALSQRYTPVDPTQVAWDLAIEGAQVIGVDNVHCDTSLTVEVYLQNLGVNSISSIDFELDLKGNLGPSGVIPVNLPAALQKGERDTLLLPVQVPVVSGGEQELVITASISNTDNDLINNRRFVRFNTRQQEHLPFAEDFESGIGSVKWYNYNEDQALTWDTIGVPDAGGQKLAAFMNFREYFPRASQLDQIWSPLLSLPPGSPVMLKFDVAYQEYVALLDVYDILRVLVSTDCGATSVEVYKKFGSDLNTTGGSGPGFIPQDRSHWRRDSVDLSAFSGQDIIVIFEGVNRNGNDLFLDNISVYSGSKDPMNLPEEVFRNFSIYPIPAEDILYIDHDNPQDQLYYQITDLSGKLIKKGSFESFQERELNVSALRSGTYLIKIVEGFHQEVHRFHKR